MKSTILFKNNIKIFDYGLINPINNKIEISRDVVVFEDKHWD